MKRLITFFLALTLIGTLFSGCGEKENPSSKESSSSVEQSESGLTYDSLPEEARQSLDDDAITFAETFTSPFSSPQELDGESVGRFSCWQLYFKDEKVNEDGICPIPKADLQAYVASHFGIENYTFPSDLPEYDDKTQCYLFYPVGEGSLVTPTITKVEQGEGDTVIYSMELFRQYLGGLDEPGTPPPTTSTATYTFRLLNVDGEYLLQAVSKSPSSPVATDPPAYFLMPNEEREALSSYALSFSQTFHSPFESPTQLDPEAVGRFSLGEIHRQNGQVNEDGVCPIPKADLQAYVASHFGIENYDYPSDTIPFDDKTQSYLFSPAKETALVTSNMLMADYGPKDMIFYRMRLSGVESEGSSPDDTVITYTFRLLNVNGEYLLQAVSAS